MPDNLNRQMLTVLHVGNRYSIFSSLLVFEILMAKTNNLDKKNNQYQIFTDYKM